MSAHPEPIDALAYWQRRRGNALDSFERNRAERMVQSIERQRKAAKGETVETVKRRNYGYGGWSRRAR
jgi:hypothetical protein